MRLHSSYVFMADIAIWQYLPYNIKMKWNVSLSKNAEKQLKKLNEKLQSIVFLLKEELQWYGPVLEKWPNYGKLHL